MWISTNKGFLSIVQHKDDPDVLIVRSRFPEHLKDLSPKARLSKTLYADYLYRISVARKDVANKLAEVIKKIDYPNFKNSFDG